MWYSSFSFSYFFFLLSFIRGSNIEFILFSVARFAMEYLLSEESDLLN